MGSRSSTETIVAILKAFLEERTWTQAELARRVGVATPVIQKRLRELQDIGIPLERELEHPHVHWSVPNNWYPGGVLFTGEQVQQLFRQLARVPKSKVRDQLLETLLTYLPNEKAPAAVLPREPSEREEQHLSAIEESANQKVALRFRYFTAHRGSEATRHASVHRVLPESPARFLATCHRKSELRWFRLDNVSEAKLDAKEPFRDADPETVERHLQASLDGFHGGRPAVRHVFFVREPESRWVALNLLEGMEYEEVAGGIRVAVVTSALERLARYVVGLGAAGKPVTPELEVAVGELARGVLESIGKRPA